MSVEVRDTNPPKTADRVNDNLVTAVKTEVKHEIQSIERTKEPVDPTHSDVLVQKHFSGLVMILLTLVALFLLAAIVGLVIFSRP